MISFNLMQTIGDNLALGFESTYASAIGKTMFSYAAKYNYKKQHYFAQYSAREQMLQFAYQMLVKRHAYFVAQMNVSPSDGSTNSILGYRQRFANSEVIATINSKGKISTLISLQGLLQLKLCATADYLKDTYKFGYGIYAGAPGM